MHTLVPALSAFFASKGYPFKNIFIFYTYFTLLISCFIVVEVVLLFDFLLVCCCCAVVDDDFLFCF